MKICTFLSALGLIITTGSLTAHAQTDSVDLNTIIDKSQKYLDERPDEKVYLHFDKPYYAVGDSIWFKAYVTTQLHMPSAISKILYVDIISGTDSLVQSLKMQVRNGMAWGTIPLFEKSYREGNYRIRAYTKWMTNNEPAYFFNKTISIGDAINNSVVTHVNYPNKPGSNKFDARIKYQNQEGAPYGNRKVTWTVENDNGELAKGKGTTNANGYINVNIAEVKNANELRAARLITVVDLGNRKQSTQSFSLKTALGNDDLQFFPEGGDLVTGVRSKVGLKAISPNGMSIDVKGTVTDNEDKVVANFTSQHLGMGTFYILPEANKTYKANVTFADGTSSTIDLPKAKTSGLVMTVNNTDPDNLNMRIVANDEYFKANQNKGIYIVAQSGGVICYGAKTILNKQAFGASIPKIKLKTGAIVVTALSANGDPLCERLAFIWRPADQLDVNLTADKKAYAKRQKVTLNLLSKAQGAPAESNFSVAVVNETSTPFDENGETTILTQILLQSNVRGHIEKPNYYFTNIDATKLDNLDALMLTQGYRHFTYKGIITGKFPPLYALPEQGIELSGTLRTLTGLPVKGGNVRLSIDDRNYSVNAITNSDGTFKFSNLIFSDSSKVTVSARNNVQAKNLMIMMDNNDYLPKLDANINTADEILNIDSTLTTYLQNSKKLYDNTHMLKEVVIKSTTIKKTVTHADYPALSALNPIADHVISPEQLGACNNFLNCLQTAALGVTFVDNNFYVTRDYNQGNKTPMQVFVKGMAVDVNYLNSLNGAEVESVEVFLKDDLGTVNRTYNTNGVLVVNMKPIPKGTPVKLSDLETLFPPKHTITLSPKGYDAVKVFYLPRYDITKSAMPGNDLRTTVFWSPNVTTSKTGTATLEYFNGDGKGTYRAVVEGIDKDGNIGRTVYRYQVN
ncbi:carboxypeptidase regulatory-like domain-containing protein [Mucilaginibacter robiniae]|uniref:Carboxypeptidase regulatory-like domain-containing protein n=1 Tax=Mucilaginibacter robiniae TaxID=2728022 RepID=A0A7L5E401_9SPHI|nr:carboxypeptidase-like regulatory domain-containing protein [Mucilaginibacter robiniae]QJD97751.1 carboxypeptidase regulatory-like domain-containing protein [Mucilaginibacter robiniae]